MSNEGDPGDTALADSDLRRRAAWLLAMLVVVAALIVLLMTTLLRPDSDHSNNAGPGPDDPGISTSAPPSSAGTSAPSSSSSPSSSGIGSAATSPVPTASCAGDTTCTVVGDLGGTQNAINAYRAQNGRKPITISNSGAADSCAISSGSNCQGSYVWVHVTSLSGSAVVQGVLGFNSSGDLLDEPAKNYSVGWAYDPSSHATYCAVIANT